GSAGAPGWGRAWGYAGSYLFFTFHKRGGAVLFFSSHSLEYILPTRSSQTATLDLRMSSTSGGGTGTTSRPSDFILLSARSLSLRTTVMSLSSSSLASSTRSF